MGLSIDDEIYKANPDVMAVVYAQTPEIVALTHGVQLRAVVNGGGFVGDGLPVVNVSTLDPKQPLLSNPALGTAVATALGARPAVLLSGNGFVMTGRSIYNVVGQSYQLRQNARIQQLAMALRGKMSYLVDMPFGRGGEGGGNAGAGPQGGGGGRGGGGRGGGGGGGQQLGPPEGRDWVYWAQTIPVR
jgi:ribulose-5-phosphate 4-epimerase/fuculose-1-phosphate aldolase